MVRRSVIKDGKLHFHTCFLKASGASASVNFDRSLPGKHTYLGTEVEVEGRTILEESQLQTLPLLSMPGIKIVKL